MNPTLLIVDDEKNTRDGLCRYLKRRYNVLAADGGPVALELLEHNAVDLVLSDIRMPGMDGVELLARIRAKYPGVAVILLTAYGEVDTAVEAMRGGAADYLSKPVNFDDLQIRIERALHSRAVEAENTRLRRQLDAKFGMENIIGSSPAMEAVFDVVRQAAPSQATVLIQGPSGTGKELVAHAIHQLSPRANGPFVAVHCAALSPTLLESELFGHERGAFTGAVGQRKGRFELADGGTLFLDEIGEIDPSVQVKLLRVLEDHTFERVGGDETLHADIRVVAATNRDLRRFVAEGKFREDLYYRLCVVDIRMPALRERAGDIPILAAHFLKMFNEKDGKSFEGFEPEAMEALQRYDWPGNVRELRNAVEKMVVLAHGPRIGLRDIPRDIARPEIPVLRNPVALESREPENPEFRNVGVPGFREAGGSAIQDPGVSGFRAVPGPPETAPVSLAEAEKAQILAVLDRCAGNRTMAAEKLGISRRTLHRKLIAWGMGRKFPR